jgi:hypothetical protein
MLEKRRSVRMGGTRLATAPVSLESAMISHGRAPGVPAFRGKDRVTAFSELAVER